MAQSTLAAIQEISHKAIEDAIFSLLYSRSLSASICPSEAAKALVGRDGDWRLLMQLVRKVGRAMLKQKQLRVTQGDNELNAEQEWKGAIRFRLPNQLDP